MHIYTPKQIIIMSVVLSRFSAV